MWPSGTAWRWNSEPDVTKVQRLAAFTERAAWEEVSEAAREQLRIRVLDSLGCGIYGAIKPHSQTAMKGILSADDSKRCGLWGTRERASAPHAALLNGTFVQGFELDDIHRRGAMHVGSTTLPAIVALSEIQGGMSGKRFLTASLRASVVIERPLGG